MLSPISTTSSNANRDRSEAICFASSYWDGSPVPKSPKARNFSEPSRLGNGTGGSEGAVGADATTGPAGCEVVTPAHAAAVTVTANASARSGRGSRRHRIVHHIDN